MNFLRNLSPLLLLVGLPIAQGTLAPAREDDYWRQAHLTIEQAQSFFTDPICYAGDLSLAACGAGFRALDPHFALPELSDVPRFHFADHLPLAIAQTKTTGSPATLMAKAINAELKIFDPHARLTTEEQFHDQVLKADRATFGIGIDFEMTASGTIVRRVYDGTPASRIGLRVGDRLLKVNGQNVEIGLRAPVALRVLGLASARRIPLEILRGDQVLALCVRPLTLHLPAVMTDRLDEVGTYRVKIRNFGGGVCAEVQRSIQRSIQRSHARSLVLDLRGNLGGGIDEASCTFKLFQDHRTFVTKSPLESGLLPTVLPLTKTFGAVEQEAWRDLKSKTLFPNLPLVVIVNAASASAAEMLASALQDAGRARLVGERTFGKGTTQGESVQTFNEDLLLIYTVSRFFRPSGAALQDQGVTPDFSVPFNHTEPTGAQTVWRERDWFGAFPGAEFLSAEPIHSGGESLVNRRLRSSIGKTYQGSPDEQLSFARALVHLSL